MIEVTLLKEFVLIKETLERIGIANIKRKVITPTCYLIFENGKYYISHFKLLLSKEKNNELISEKDINRQNAIISMLKNWNMIDIIDDSIYQEPLKEKIFVLSFKNKNDYKINHKFEEST